MNFVIFFLLILVIILSLKYLAIKKQIHSISCQIEQVVSCESEKMLDISFVESDIELLAGQRSSSAKTLSHKEQQKTP